MKSSIDQSTENKTKRMIKLGISLLSGMLLLITLGAFKQFPAVAHAKPNTETNQIVGQIIGSNGAPISGALVRAQERQSGNYESALSDSNGAYTLTLDAGLWVISSHHSTSTVPNDWFWNMEPIIVDFFDDGVGEEKQVDFEFPLSQTVVRGFAKMPDGSAPPFDVIVSLKTADGYGISRPARDSDGFFWRIARSGSFTLQLLPQDPNYVGPPAQQFDLAPGDLIDMGELNLISKSGTVLVSATDPNNDFIVGVQLLAYSADGATAMVTTGSTGTVNLPLPPGDWTLHPQIPAALPFLYDGDPFQAMLQANQSVTVPAFALQSAPNLITGTVQDSSNGQILLDGWLTVGDELGNYIRSAEVQTGAYALYLPDGDYRFFLTVSPGSSHFAAGPLDVTVSGQDQTVTLPVLSASTPITGSLWDPREEEVVTDTLGLITAASGEMFQQTVVVSQTGGIQFRLPQGDWAVGYDLGNGSTHLPLDRSFEIKVEDAASHEVELPVAKVDAAITGRVMAPNGDMVENAWVYARGESAELKQVFVQAQTDEDGRYYLQIPHGRYTLWSDLGLTNPDGWVSPADQLLTIGVKGIRPGVNFKFQNSDVALSGQLLMPDGSAFQQSAKLWAVSGAGEYVDGTVSSNGAYALPLLANHGWHIYAAAEKDGSIFRLDEEVSLTSYQTQDLRFTAETAFPAVQQFIFDADKLAKLEINDDMSILIPANTFPMSGPVMLLAKPIPPLADRIFNRQIGTGYALSAFDQFGNPFTASYYQNLLVTLYYDPDELNSKELLEDNLRPAVFELQNSSWQQPNHFVIDKNRASVTLESNFLATYTLFAGEPQQDSIYLPLIRR